MSELMKSSQEKEIELPLQMRFLLKIIDMLPEQIRRKLLEKIIAKKQLGEEQKERIWERIKKEIK